MDVELRQLSVNDGKDIYQMLQEMPELENGFTNGANGLTYKGYGVWLARRDNESKGIGLGAGKVPQTCFWLYVDGCPVGFGKIRHNLTDRLRVEGGHIGYGIRPTQRGKGYGNIIVKLLVEQARKMNISKILVTVFNSNLPSIKACTNNGGVVTEVNDIRHYIWF